MNATITLSFCPRCNWPLAALRVGDARAVSWLRIEDQVIDLGAVPLAFCPFCRAALPVLNFVPAAAAVAVAGDESAVTP